MKNLFHMFSRPKQELVYSEFQEDDYLAAPFAEFEAVEDQLERIEKKIDKLMEMLNDSKAR